MRLRFSVVVFLCLALGAAFLWRPAATTAPSRTMTSSNAERHSDRTVARQGSAAGQREALRGETVQAPLERERPTIPAEIGHGPFRASLEVLADQPLRRALAKWRALQIPREDQASVRADVRGMLYYVCAVPEGLRTAAALAKAQDGGRDRLLTGAAAVPISKPPVKHSLKGSKNVLYLDFNGHVIKGTYWNTKEVPTFKAKPYDTDGNPAKFSDAEQAEIIEIWSRVAEDFAPFDVDVTTEEPAKFGPTVAHALITDAFDESGLEFPSSGGGGIAYIGVFGDPDFATKASPALVYHTNLHSVAAVAESASHELGHNLGLSHDGQSGVEYYEGHGTGETSWGPIMGGAFGRNLTQWSKGEYFDANNDENDVSIITKELGLKKTGAGASRENAKALSTSGNKISHKGVLTSASGDWYSFSTGAGKVTLAVSTFRAASGSHGGNADLRIDLVDASGKVVASNNPGGKTAASLTYQAAKGLYYLRVRGAAEGKKEAPTSNPPSGYTSYGSLGQYGISGTFIAGPPAITSAKSASVAGGASFTYKIVATNSATSYSASGLPSGLKIDKKTGVISGRPTKKGTFSVKLSAKNGQGTGTVTLKLTVKAAAPAITSQSSGLKIVKPGSSTSLKVSAISVSGKATYQWYLNGKKVSGGTKTTLKAKTTGYYIVKIKNSTGTTTSKAIFVRAAPKTTKVFAWGNNDAGQTKVPSKLTTAVAVGQGYQHSLALKSDGTVVGWGGNSSGQAKPPSGLKKVVDIAAGNYHSVALKSDGTVVAWGNGYYEQTAVPKSLKNVVAIAAGGDHVLALKSNGTVVAWGRNEYGQTKIPKGLKNVIAIAAGDRHSLALKNDGTVVAWGRNDANQRSVPKGLKSVVEISAGAAFSIARKSDGSIVSWGSAFGLDKLPDGVTAVKAIAAGSTHVVAITKDGKAVAFGSSSYGQINVPSKLKKPIAVSAGWWSSIAVHDATK